MCPHRLSREAGNADSLCAQDADGTGFGEHIAVSAIPSPPHTVGPILHSACYSFNFTHIPVILWLILVSFTQLHEVSDIHLMGSLVARYTLAARMNEYIRAHVCCMHFSESALYRFEGAGT